MGLKPGQQNYLMANRLYLPVRNRKKRRYEVKSKDDNSVVGYGWTEEKAYKMAWGETEKKKAKMKDEKEGIN